MTEVTGDPSPRPHGRWPPLRRLSAQLRCCSDVRLHSQLCSDLIVRCHTQLHSALRLISSAVPHPLSSSLSPSLHRQLLVALPFLHPSIKPQPLSAAVGVGRSLAPLSCSQPQPLASATPSSSTPAHLSPPSPPPCTAAGCAHSTLRRVRCCCCCCALVDTRNTQLRYRYPCPSSWYPS